MLLSVLIPAHNEEGDIGNTIKDIHRVLAQNNIPNEILVINDNSTDNTENILKYLQKEVSTLRYVNNAPPNGFGYAIKKGLDEFKGDCVAILMADASDSPDDLAEYYKKIAEGYDCAFGSRFHGARVIDYPKFKYFLNRAGNFLIKKVFSLPYDDITNAFKCYRREVIEKAKPLLSNHFNITVELPIKSIIYGYKYSVVPTSWINRKHGKSKLDLKKMMKQYLLIVLFLFLHKYLSEK